MDVHGPWALCFRIKHKPSRWNGAEPAAALLLLPLPLPLPPPPLLRLLLQRERRQFPTNGLPCLCTHACSCRQYEKSAISIAVPVVTTGSLIALCTRRHAQASTSEHDEKCELHTHAQEEDQVKAHGRVHVH